MKYKQIGPWSHVETIFEFFSVPHYQSGGRWSLAASLYMMFVNTSKVGVLLDVCSLPSSSWRNMP